MEDVTLTVLQPDEFQRYSGWMNDSATDLLLKSSDALDTSNPQNTLAWKVLRGEDVVAVVMIHVDGRHVGHLNLVVHPTARRQGVGNRAMELLVNEPALRQLNGLLSSVSASNTGAQKILIKNGFSRVGYSDDGALEFQRTT